MNMEYMMLMHISKLDPFFVKIVVKLSAISFKSFLNQLFSSTFCVTH